MFGEYALEKLVTGEALYHAQSPGSSMDSDAFSGFYQRSARPLWAYLARVSGDPALADDLMQEAYLRFLGAAFSSGENNASTPDGEVASRRYLFRIATNLLRDHWRRPKASSIEEVPEALLDSGLSGLRSDAQELLGPALLLLRPRDQQLLWLAYAEGYSHREIAEITGLQSTSIRLLLFRARHRAAKLLREQTADPQPARAGIRWFA